MIYGKMWLVVKPSVGVPLLLGGVVVGSLIVHGALMANTTWFKRYWEGGMKTTAVATAPADTAAAAPPAAAPKK